MITSCESPPRRPRSHLMTMVACACPDELSKRCACAQTAWADAAPDVHGEGCGGVSQRGAAGRDRPLGRTRRSSRGTTKAEERVYRLQELAKEAYPFPIMVDAHRISNIISSYAPGHTDDPIRRDPRTQKLLVPRGVMEIYGRGNRVQRGSFASSSALGAWLQHKFIDTSDGQRWR